jgi:hypothetical protein
LAPENGINITNSEPLVFGCDLNGNNIINELDDGQNTACNYLNYDDVTAYLWWAVCGQLPIWNLKKLAEETYPWLQRNLHGFRL